MLFFGHLLFAAPNLLISMEMRYAVPPHPQARFARVACLQLRRCTSGANREANPSGAMVVRLIALLGGRYLTYEAIANRRPSALQPREWACSQGSWLDTKVNT
jgi:hypothetical protein